MAFASESITSVILCPKAWLNKVSTLTTLDFSIGLQPCSVFLGWTQKELACWRYINGTNRKLKNNPMLQSIKNGTYKYHEHICGHRTVLKEVSEVTLKVSYILSTTMTEAWQSCAVFQISWATRTWYPLRSSDETDLEFFNSILSCFIGYSQSSSI